MLGIIPAAGSGTRIQPLAFSKELLPVGSRYDGSVEKPKAISEYVVERMIMAGIDKLCFVISPGKTDILKYYGDAIKNVSCFYVIQSEPQGLCSALFKALPFAGFSEQILVGLPDTIWFPEYSYSQLPDNLLSFVLFPVNDPQNFDAVIVDAQSKVQEIKVKDIDIKTKWVWGGFKLNGLIFRRLYSLWKKREMKDLYLGTLVNSYIEEGGKAYGYKIGTNYVDVGTLHGYREAGKLLSELASAKSLSNTHLRGENPL